MLKKLKGAFGFLAGLAPHLVKLTGIMQLLGSLINVKIAAGDSEAITAACLAGHEATAAARVMLDEADQAFDAVAAAVDPDGPGGTAMTYEEIKGALLEAKDVAPAGIEVGRKFDAVLDQLKKLA